MIPSPCVPVSAAGISELCPVVGYAILNLFFHRPECFANGEQLATLRMIREELTFDYVLSLTLANNPRSVACEETVTGCTGEH